MGCCCSCLNACCCTEAGLRCHFVVTLCGFFYFILMFLLFERQKPFFEFEMTDSQGIKWACLASSLLWLFLFFLVLIQMMSQKNNPNQHRNLKNKISIADVKQLQSAKAKASIDRYDEDEPLKQVQK